MSSTEIRVFKDPVARSIVMNNTSIGSQFVNQLHAIADDGFVTILDMSKEVSFEDAEDGELLYRVAHNVVYSLFFDIDGNALGASLVLTVDALNAIFQDTGSGTDTSAPTITSPLTIATSDTTPILYTMTADLGVSYYWANLPTGLFTLNGDSRTISGTVAVAGDYNITMTAVNYYGTTSETLVLSVSDTPETYFNSKSVLFGNNMSAEMDTVDATSPLARDAATGDPWTVSVWIKPSANSNKNQTVLGCGLEQKNAQSMYISYDGTDKNIEFQYGTDTDNIKIVTDDDTITSGVWAHVVVVYDGGSTGPDPGSVNDYYSRFNIYINGVEVVRTNSHNGGGYGDAFLMSVFKVGSRADGSKHLRDAFKVDELVVLDTDSTVTEPTVATLYNSGLVPDMASHNPVHWFRMGDVSTFPTLIDSGTAVRNLTMCNMNAGTITNDAPPSS